VNLVLESTWRAGQQLWPAPSALTKIRRRVFRRSRVASAPPSSLAEFGIPEAGLEVTRNQVMAAPYANPRPVTADAVAAILHAAQRAARPQASSAAGVTPARSEVDL
jgi:hypothetical protein